MTSGTDFKKHLTPIWIIYMDGERLNKHFEAAFQTVKVFDRLNAVSICNITFNYNELESKDTKAFPPFTQVSVHLGYKDDTREVFKGEVTASGIELSRDSKALFIVTASSYLQRLGHGTHTRVFENKTPSQAIQWLLEHYDLKAECDNFGKQKVNLGAGRDLTDLQALFILAKKYGKDVCCVGDKVYVKELMTHRKDELIYEWGKSLISFEIKESSNKQVGEVQIQGWDVTRNKGFKGQAKLSELNQKIGGNKDLGQIINKGLAIEHLFTHSVNDEAEANEIAQGYLRERSFKLIRAEGKAEGNCKLSSGSIVDVKYVGKRYSGEYIAETVVHSFSLEEGYINEMYLKRNMFPSDYKSPGSGFVDKYADEANKKKSTEQEAVATNGNNNNGSDNGDEDKTDDEDTKKTITINLEVLPENNFPAEKFILFSTDKAQTYYKELSESDCKSGEGTIYTLEFNDVDVGLNYSLKVDYGSKGKTYFAFEDIPYNNLV